MPQPKRSTPAYPADFSQEAALRAKGVWPIAGIDEAGRGPLAGPVCAAAIILDPANLPPGLADSKTLSERKREALFEEIAARALAIGIGLASAEEIDRVNIRQATFLAMRRAAAALSLPAAFAIIDGRDVPPHLCCPGEAIIRGDALSLSIAAASIIAKVTRDRLMTRLGARYPQYGFERHMGYPSAAHRAALKKYGPCPFHRLTFGALKTGF